MTPVLVYITHSIAWSAGGFFFGYLFGEKAFAKTLGFSMTHPLSEKPGSKSNGDGRTRRPWYKNLNAWVGGLVVVVGAVTALNWQVQGSRTDALVKCQQAYTTGFADALDARTKAAADLADAQDELWRVVQSGFTAPSPDIRARFQNQLDTYLNARAKSKQAQHDNPYPPAPRDLCGGA